MIDKWIRKYMKLAKALADDNTACYSRKIGCVLISEDNEPIGFGYNGSATGIPHNDDRVYLAHLWANLLTREQKDKLIEKYELKPVDYDPVESIYSFPLYGKQTFSYFYNKLNVAVDATGEAFLNKFTGCKSCPRKLLDIPSGECMELCACSHSERNSIFNAAKRGTSTKNSTMYCWCGCPCFECTVAIIQAKIKKVVCLETGTADYSKSSRYLYEMANIELVEVKEKDIFND